MASRNTVAISRIREESSSVRTFFFSNKSGAKPGQFIMLTDFETGEKPFSISECEEDYFAVTIKRVGKFTEQIFRKKSGDLLSWRGPYGSSFRLEKRKCLLVGGGYAVPTLYFLSQELLKTGAQVTVVNGARSKEELLYCEKFRELEMEYRRITDAGCFGRSGTSVDVARELLLAEEYEMVYVSGPEMMMKAMQRLLSEYPGLDYEFLFERYMKCAIGICGNCTMDPLGIRLCVEGPVLGRDKVEQLQEFGRYHRDAAGTKHRFGKK